MPQAVMHVLLTIIVLDLFRDYIVKNKKEVPLHFIFIGGIAGLLPDIDIPLFWLINNILGFQVEWFHRTFSHSIFFPLIFLIASLIIYRFNKKYSLLSAIVSFGITFHLLLDLVIAGFIMPMYPITMNVVGFNLVELLGLRVIVPALDAIILIAWLWHEERKHKISDFI